MTTHHPLRTLGDPRLSVTAEQPSSGIPAHVRGRALCRRASVHAPSPGAGDSFNLMARDASRSVSDAAECLARLGSISERRIVAPARAGADVIGA